MISFTSTKSFNGLLARLHWMLYQCVRVLYRQLPLPQQWKWRVEKFFSRHYSTLLAKPPIPLPTGTTLPINTAGWMADFYGEISNCYEAISLAPLRNSEIKLIVFYLPQFHPIPENDKWWGKGFTEWTNVSKAKPQFRDHYQPHLPGELGFYDLRLVDVQRKQIELAKHYGIYGFCYYYYWFNGKRVLDLPLNQVLSNPDLDSPFCICWANENWTRRWDGQEHELLLEQLHSPESDFKFIEDVAPIFRDRRYIKVDNKPVLIVYRPGILPDLKATALRWRSYCARVGIGDIYLMAAKTFGFVNPTSVGFDAAVEFPPHAVMASEVTREKVLYNPSFRGKVWSYSEVVENGQFFTAQDYPVFRAVMPAWDNTARRGESGNIFWGSSPALYQKWLEFVCEHTIRHFPPENRFVFVNAWNEWAEGAHLEPDRCFGYAYLNATAAALGGVSRSSTHARKKNRNYISVIVPAYNHEKYVNKALTSLKTQTLKDFEVIIVNDGSTDRTLGVIKEFMDKNPEMSCRLLDQNNCGAHEAINRGVSEAAGTYVAILNSDDFYHPERLETLLEALENSGSLLTFSDVELVGENDEPPAKVDSCIVVLRKKLSQLTRFQNIGYALLDFNFVASTGNLFFNRRLFDLIGGFTNLRYCHDWDFVLTALRYTTPVFVPKRLYNYRLHDENSFRDLQNLAEKESDIVLEKFFTFEQCQGQVRPDFPSYKNDSKYFSRFVEQHHYEKYVRRALKIYE